MTDKAVEFRSSVLRPRSWVDEAGLSCAHYQQEETSTLFHNYVYGPVIDEPVCMIDVSDNDAEYYYQFDGLGSVAALSDEDGSLVEKYSYDVFGEATIRDSSDQIQDASQYDNPYMFTGRRFDEESDLYYYRARYYAYDVGRFLQVDPIGYANGMNIYAYVKNGPINQTDPMGLHAGYFPIGPGVGPYIPPSGGHRGWVGERCCKEWGAPLHTQLGMGLIECANSVMSEANKGWITPGLIGGGIIGIVYPPIGIGVGVGLGGQYGVALGFCSSKECEKWGHRNECGKCL